MIGRLPTPLQRIVYRVGYVVVTIASRILRPHTRGVKCLVVCEEAVLLLRHTYGPAQWDLPGGFSRRREELADTARREIAEELGVRDGRWTDLGERERAMHGRRERLGLFRVEVATRELELDPGEIAEARWCRRDELPFPRAEIVDVVLARSGA